MSEPNPDVTDDATRESDEEESHAAHVADRPPTSEEEDAADSNVLDPEVAEHEREMGKRGAEVRGEGQIS